MQGFVKKLCFLLLVLALTGCATTYVPISWGQGDGIKKLSREDLFLSILFNRYDPDRSTLRVAGTSFDEVMMPDEVKFHLGAYRPDTKIIYRNLYKEYNSDQFRALLLHELSHHVWYNGLTTLQREEWRLHLATNPTAYQPMVRSTYKAGTDYDSEDFAFAMEHARPIDIQQLATLKVITPEERDRILKQKFPDYSDAPKTAQTAPADKAAEAVDPVSDDVDGFDIKRPKPVQQTKDQTRQHEYY